MKLFKITILVLALTFMAQPLLSGSKAYASDANYQLERTANESGGNYYADPRNPGN